MPELTHRRSFKTPAKCWHVFSGGVRVGTAALRADAGCELLALSNCLLRRNDQLACAVFTPLDFLEQRHIHR